MIIPKYKNHWIVYFDILGFQNYINATVDNESTLLEIVNDYELVLREIEKKTSYYPGHELGCTWFSDTFIIFSKDDGIKSYTIIQQAATHLLATLLYKQIPLRGALSFGKMYINEEKNIFLGPALIEAYKYGEDQNWINFTITPSAKNEILRCGLNPLHHSFTDSSNCFRQMPSEDTYSYTFCSGSASFDSPHISILQSMVQMAPSEAVKKYENTIRHIKRFWKKL